MCLIGLEASSVLGLHPDMGVMSIGEEIHMSSSRIFQWSRLIGDVHLLYVHNFLHGVSILGRHILQDQVVIINQSRFHQGLCSDDIHMKKEPGSVGKLGHVTQLLFEGTDHRCITRMAGIIRVFASSLGYR